MVKTLKKMSISAIAVLLVVVMLVITTFGRNSCSSMSPLVRTIVLSEELVDYEAVLAEFDNGNLEQGNGVTSFTGSQFLDASLLEELDNLSECEINELAQCEVYYSFSYDANTNIVSLSAYMHNEFGELEIDELQGLAFINSQGEIDALMDVDGETILLSEMQQLGVVQNCGLFSKIIKAAVAVVVVAAVVAVVVATAGAGMAAVVGAAAIAGAVVGGISGGLISYSEYGKLDWKWVVGGTLVGAALGAVTGWGVGTAMGVGSAGSSSQVSNLINTAKNGKLGVKDSLVNKGYLNPNSANYRSYYEYLNTLSKEIMSAKAPIVEEGTGYLKWVVEGAYGSTTGYWELVIDPINKVVAHFLFAT